MKKRTRDIMPVVPIRSNWPHMAYSPLTDEKIVRYARAGRYGPEMKDAFAPKKRVSRRKLILMEYK